MNYSSNQIGLTQATVYDISAADLAGANSGQRPDLLAKTQAIFRTPDGKTYSANAARNQLVAAAVPAVARPGAAYPEQYGYSDSNTITANTAAINALVADGNVLLLGDREYVVNAPISPPDANTALIVRGVGRDARSAYSSMRGTHTGFIFQPAGNYDIEGLIITGEPTQTMGIGSLGVEGASGAARLNNVYMSGLKHAVLFDSAWEHPLGIDYDRVYVQNFDVSGIVLGGSGAASSGESALSVGSIVVTNNSRTPTSHAITTTANTPSTSFDTISWSGITEPYFGFLLIRSLDGSTNWQCVPNLHGPITGATSFQASKTAGETWFYKLITCTVGAQFNRIKASGVNSIQTEYTGIGLWLKSVVAFSAQSTYSENRPQTIGRSTLAAVYAESSNVHIDTIWSEYASYPVINRGSSVTFNDIKASNSVRGVIGQYDNGNLCPVRGGFISQSGTSVPEYVAMTNGAREYAHEATLSAGGNITKKLNGNNASGYEVFARGVFKGAIRTNAASESEVVADRGQFTAPNKTFTPLLNSGQQTALTSAVPTDVLTVTVQAGVGSVAIVPFLIRVADSGSVNRQAMGGLLTISTVSAAGTVAATVTVSGLAKTQQSGTITDPVFTVAVAGSVVTIACSVTTSVAAPIMRFVAALQSSIGGAPVVTQL